MPKLESDHVGRLRRPTGLRIAATKSSPENEWSGLSDATDEATYCSAWFSMQCARISGVEAGLLATLKPSGQGFSIAAVWPDSRVELPNLARLVEHAFASQQIAISRDQAPKAAAQGGARNLLIAVPLGVDEVIAVAAVTVATKDGTPGVKAESIARELRWGAGWLSVLPWVRSAIETNANASLAASCLEFLVLISEQNDLNGMMIAIVNELAARLDCDRASLGLLKRNGTVRLGAISHSSKFKSGGRLVDAIENAMEEAVDQDATVACPPIDSTAKVVALAHEALLKTSSSSGKALISVILRDGSGRSIGVLTLECRDGKPFDGKTAKIAEALAAVAGTVLGRQVRAHRLFAGRLVDRLESEASAFFCPGRPGRKLAAAPLVAIAFFLLFATGEYRVTARAVLEPVVRRAIVAPFDGYIDEAFVRAGDRVQQGSELARLDNRDLVLDELRWRAERDKLLQQRHEALAEHDPIRAGIITAQIRQAEAALSLAQAKVERSRIRAPFEGVVVSGDLSQSLGSPVDKGQTLFEVAPPGTYRLILQIDERDVRHLALGQKGRVRLASLPGAPLPFVITRIVPVTKAEEGRNTLRVEASLDRADPSLKPGLEGVGKIETGRRSLLWIWTHSLTDAVRLAAWKYLP